MNADLNVLNFERVKWGGIRLNQLIYCWLDIELLSHEDGLTVDEEDIAILRKLIATVDGCAETESPRHLEKRLKDVLPSSKYERDVLMEVLGYAGVLVPKDTPARVREGTTISSRCRSGREATGIPLKRSFSANISDRAS